MWNIKEGYLDVIEPVNERFCDFTNVPVSVVTHSRSCDITAEVIHLERLDNLKTNDIRGKFILTTENPREVLKKISELGAEGILSYPNEERAKGYNHLIQYLSFWPDATTVSQTTAGFSLSRVQANKLIKFMIKKSIN